MTSWSLVNLTSCSKAPLLCTIISKLDIPWAVVFDYDAAFNVDTSGSTHDRYSYSFKSVIKLFCGRFQHSPVYQILEKTDPAGLAKLLVKIGKAKYSKEDKKHLSSLRNNLSRESIPFWSRAICNLYYQNVQNTTRRKFSKNKKRWLRNIKMRQHRKLCELVCLFSCGKKRWSTYFNTH